MEMTPTERLERINELKEDGIITEEEFEAKKEELLGQI
jgi:DNA-binding Lrp family transcriptional regulator